MGRRKKTLRRFFCPRPPFVGAPQNTTRLPPPCAVYGGPLLKQMSRELFQNEETRDGETAFSPMISRRPRLCSEQKLKQNSELCFTDWQKKARARGEVGADGSVSGVQTSQVWLANS